MYSRKLDLKHQAMDQTALFRACVKAVKVRHKQLQVRPAPSRPPPAANSFACRASTCVNLITKLRDYLISNRAEYMDSCCRVSSSIRLQSAAGAINPDRIDADAETSIKNCQQLVKHLQSIASADRRLQSHDHENAVVAIIELYLKAVCGMYASQRAHRTKRQAAVGRYSRLSALLAVTGALPQTSTTSHTDSPSGSRANKDKKEGDVSSSTVRRRQNVNNKAAGASGDGASQSVVLSAVRAAELDQQQQPNLDDDEQQALMLENEQLYRRVNTLHDDLEQLEGNVVEIARLQQLFTTNVLEQDVAVLNINQTAVHTTENIKDANDFIREAMKRQASMRVYLIFSLLVLTFTLWFLDWYNP